MHCLGACYQRPSRRPDNRGNEPIRGFPIRNHQRGRFGEKSRIETTDPQAAAQGAKGNGQNDPMIELVKRPFFRRFGDS